MLAIVSSYHRIQFQGRQTVYTQEDGKKPHFGSYLDLLGPNSGCQAVKFFSLN